MAQANQQKQFDEINRAAILSRIQAARPVQQMGMVSFTLSLMYRWSFGFWVDGKFEKFHSKPKISTFSLFQIHFLSMSSRKNSFYFNFIQKTSSCNGGRLEINFFSVIISA